MRIQIVLEYNENQEAKAYYSIESRKFRSDFAFRYLFSCVTKIESKKGTIRLKPWGFDGHPFAGHRRPSRGWPSKPWPAKGSGNNLN